MKVYKLEYKKWNKKNIFIKILDVIHPSKTFTLYTEHYNDNSLPVILLKDFKALSVQQKTHTMSILKFLNYIFFVLKFGIHSILVKLKFDF